MGQEYYKPKVCEICGHTYQREQCPHCIYKEKWEQKPLDKKASIFPPRVRQYLEKDLEFQEPLEPCRSLYIHGDIGSGKTLFACCMVYQEMKNAFISRDRKASAYFLPVTDLLAEIKEGYNKNISDQDIIDKYKKVDWLIIDDIGTENLTDWSYSILYSIINYRYENLKKTVYTSNLSFDQLSNKVQDQRVVRRIEEMVDGVIKFTK